MDAATGELLSRVGREGTTLSLARLDRAAAARFVQERVGVGRVGRRGARLRSQPGQPAVPRGDDAPAGTSRAPRRSRRAWSRSGVRDVIRQRLDRVARRDARAARPGGRRRRRDRSRRCSRRRPGATRPGSRRASPRRRAPACSSSAGATPPLRPRAVPRGALPRAAPRTSGARCTAASRTRWSGSAPGAARRDRAPRAGGSAASCSRAPSSTRSARPARAQELLALRRGGRARCPRARRGRPRRAIRRRCARASLLALGEARIRRGEAAAGKEDCREAATLARDAGRRRAGRAGGADLRQRVHVRRRRSGAGRDARGVAGGAAARRQRAARAPAGPPGRRAAAEPDAATSRCGRARGDRDRAPPRRRRRRCSTRSTPPIAALMDIVDPAETRALNLEAERLALAANDRERLLRTHLRLAICHLGLGEIEACDARIAAFEALAAELRAPWYALVGAACCARCARRCRAGSTRPSGWRPRRATPGAPAGHEAAERIWITNREALLRAAERHDEMLAWEPEARRVARASSTSAAAWQAMGSALHARAARARGRGAPAHRPAARVVSPAGRQPVRAAASSARRSRVGGPRELAAALYERIAAAARRCVMLGMSYIGWEGPWARLLGAAGGVARTLGRGVRALRGRDRALPPARRAPVPRAHRVRVRAGAARARRARDARARALLASARAGGRGARDAGAGAPGRRAARGRSARRQLGARAPTQRVAAAPRAGAGAPPFAFAREGEYWAVTHAGATFRLKDSLGIQYLVRLLEQPGREIHVLDLAGERAAGGAGVERGDRHRRRGRAAGRRGAARATSAGSRIWKRRSPRPSRSATRARAARARGGDRDAGRRAGPRGRAGRPGAAGGRGGRAGPQRGPAPHQERHRAHRRARPGPGRAARADRKNRKLLRLSPGPLLIPLAPLTRRRGSVSRRIAARGTAPFRPNVTPPGQRRRTC